MSSARSRRLSGYTLIEAMVSVVVVGIAVVGCLAALSAMMRSEDRALTTEKMHRLASEKFDEIVATADYVNTSLSGTFEDRGEPGFAWQVDVAPTGESNLEAVTVTVTKESGSLAEPVKVVGVMYVPPTETGTAAGAGGARP